MPAVRRRLRAIVVLAAAVTAGLAAQAVPAQNGQTPIEPPKGTGLLMGQVVDASTVKPIAAAIVSISGGSPTTTVLPTGEVVIVNSPVGGPAATAAGAPRQVMTDEAGRFMFRELSHGRYTLRVTAPGYLAGSYGQNRPTGASQSIELVSDDEKRGDLTVRIWKGASVSGTVVDEIGEPVVGFSVRVIRRTMVGGKPRLAPGNQATTDDRGVFRMSGLIPGDFLLATMSTQTTMPAATVDAYMQQIMAGGSSINSDIFRELNSSGAPYPSTGGYRVGDLILQSGQSGRGGNAAPPAPADDARVFVYPTQYYPAAGVSSQATVLTLASGENRGGINLQLRLSPTVRVSGTVIGPDGPARNLGVKLLPLGADEFTSDSGIETASTATDALGVFTFLGVTPGQYTLKCLRVPRPVTSSSPSNMTTIEVNGPNGVIMGMSSSGPSSGPPPPLPTELSLSATMPVSVGDNDVTGLSIALRPGVRVSGRLAFEGTKTPPTPDQLQRASISISPVGGSAPLQILTAAKRVETDGRFSTVGFPPGRYTVSANVPNAPGGGVPWALKSAMFGGHDVSDEGLEVTGEDVAGIVITFTDRATELSGTVLDATGRPDKTADVIIIPADSQSWKDGVMNVRRLRNVRTSTTGAYSVANLPPGSYLVAAVSDETLGEWQDPKILEKIAALGTRVTIGDGEKKTQELTTRIVR